jgi:hypothetical protein
MSKELRLHAGRTSERTMKNYFDDLNATESEENLVGGWRMG